jgi:phosphoglucomutase
MRMQQPAITSVPTVPFEGQRPGTSGLRKKTRVFLQPHYLENFVQSVFDAICEEGKIDFGRETLLVGGDGRYYNREAIQKILRMAAANGFGKVLIGRGGLLSTPAMSAAIRRRGALGGILLTASHNPGGIDADFGVKYNIRNGGPAPEGVTERIYAETQRISGYLTIDAADIDLDREHSVSIGSTEVTVFDPMSDYILVMESLFDFDALRALFRGGFRLLFDAMHGVTGPYAYEIFVRKLGASEASVIRQEPLPDFAGLHPDPNQVHAAELVRRMSEAGAPDIGAACDGDGDRNMILGRNFFVTPGDSVAVIAQHAAAIPGYRDGLAGVARSMPTSTALDRVAGQLGIRCFETPTGWKYFGNLMDAGMCTICGEESFGTGSSHVREKDGLWAVLCWISILAESRKSVEKVLQELWTLHQRSYFQRHDYEALDAGKAGEMFSELRKALPGLSSIELPGGTVAVADDFSYTDPVDGSSTAKQGVRLIFRDGSRVVIRLSGTGTEGATLRIYLERVLPDWNLNVEKTLEPLRATALGLLELQRRFGRTEPDVIT